MKKPYVKNIAAISKFTAWLVDGQYVRTKLDEEFTNFGQHYRFRFIPRNEFWIDHLHAPGEEHFYIDHLLLENRLMAAGMDYDQALEKADRAELKERRKVDLLRRGPASRRASPIVIRKIHRHLLRSYSRDLRVWVVRGELVRDLFFIDFTEGGHDRVYKFVPPGEVWLDDDLRRTERPFVLLHEVHERRLMVHGLDYFRAHRSASHLEYFCRHHPRELRKKLAEELRKNRDSLSARSSAQGA
jgi:hypothetical protein